MPTLAAERQHSAGSTASADQACEAARGIALAVGECNTARTNVETTETVVIDDPLHLSENQLRAEQGNRLEEMKSSLSLL